MKNITNYQTCQTEITTKINNRSLPVVKPKKKRKTPDQLFNRTKQDRSLSYDHRSDNYKIRKIRKQAKSPYLSDRKLLSFLAPYCVPLETKFPAVNDIYIYNYYTHTKRVASYDQLIIQERLKKERLTMNVSKMFHSDDDSQPKYVSSNSQKQEQQSNVSQRSNVSAYKTWEPPLKKKLDPIAEVKKFVEWYDTEIGKQFIAFHGKETAEKLIRVMMNNIIEDARE